MYLVPPCTALLAWILFEEVLTPTRVVGDGPHGDGRVVGGESPE